MTIKKSLKWFAVASIIFVIIGAGLLTIFTNSINRNDLLLYVSILFIILYTIFATYYLLINNLVKRNIIDGNSKSLFHINN